MILLLGAISRRLLLTAPAIGAPLSSAPAIGAPPAWLSEVPLDSEAFLEEEPRDEPLKDSSFVERVKRRQATGSLKATERLRVSVRVARSDGTFATRDEGEQPLYGDLDISLFGLATPANVALFLELALGDDLTYKRSNFDEITGDVLICSIPGLDERELFGERILVYNNREVFASRADRQLEAAAVSEKSRPIDRKGLLLRRRTRETDVDFGLTLSDKVDGDWIVIGQVDKDDSGLLDAIAQLPTYSKEAVGDFAKDTPFAADVFNAQRSLFRSAASKLGDTRLKSVFPGKILRRVEVTNIQLL